MATDFYRNESWNEEIEKYFFTKLARARTQRDQYLVIQALTLEKFDPHVAIRLINLYFETKKSSFEDLRALSVKADALISIGQIDSAIDTMKDILAIERIKPNQKTNMYVDYPFFIAIQGISSEFIDALAVLEERKNELVFPVSKFKWHAAKSLIYQTQKNAADAKQQATLALKAAQVKFSGFRYHEDLGIVGEKYKDTIAALREIHA